MALNRMVLFLVLPFLVGAGCTSVQHISKSEVRYELITASAEDMPDESMLRIIEPYKNQIEVEMNEVVGQVGHELTKKKPESTLGNWYTDAMMARIQEMGLQADLAISNYGGLRVPYITAGPLTRGGIYELAPFDNLLVIVDVPGVELDSLFQQIASTEGWPISSGVRMVIRDKRMVKSSINGKPIDPAAIYKVAMPDYVANGGDGLNMLIPLPRLQTGIVVRDMLIAHAQQTMKNGQEISSSIEGRIVIQN